MNVVNAAVLRNNFGEVLSLVTKKKDYFLVAKRGKITSALVNIDFFEDLLAMTNKGYLDSIKRARQEYENGDVVTHEQAFGEV